MTKKSLIIAGFGMALATVGITVSAAMAAGTVSVPGPIAVCPVFSRSLSIGVSGGDVTELQGYLNAKGYLAVSATGYFGPLTQSAVARWQAQGNVVALGGSGSGIFGPLSRAYFARSCGGNGGGGTATTTSFTANPSSGVAPLTVQFTASAPQGGTLGNSVNFGDGTSGTIAPYPTFSASSMIGGVSHTYTAPGTYTATLTSGVCSCPANGICNCPNMMIIGTATVTVTATSTGIQELNAPGSVTTSAGGTVEVRNASFYFTLASVTQSTATIDITPVGCWNSFPSDQPPAIRCMIAVVPTPPQTLSIGQAYVFSGHTITLTNIVSGAASFEVQ